MANNWLICGCSPFVIANEYSVSNRPIIYADKLDMVKELMGECTTIGLNYFPLQCDYRFVMDCGHVVTTHQVGERLVIPRELLPELRYYNSVGREALLIEPYYTYDIGTELSCVNSVCEPAIEYAYKQGADAIILLGVDLTEGWQSKQRTDATKQIIYKYPNVYKVNEKSEVDVPLWNRENLN